jgi:hypothetical protein
MNKRIRALVSSLAHFTKQVSTEVEPIEDSAPMDRPQSELRAWYTYHVFIVHCIQCHDQFWK